ncbi:MAG: hypothetical protein ACR2PI_12600 [Hyphomicrobiaceae bacterium]
MAHRTIICMKWGTRYGPEYVNRLASMVRRNVTQATRFVCFTDDTTGIDDGIELHPLPSINIPDRVAWTPWRKLSVWQHPLAQLAGDVLFLDLDLVITGSLDDFFDYRPGAYIAIDNWTQPGQGVGNTSAFRFPAGQHTRIFDDFVADPEVILGKWRIEQQYISDTIPEMVFWPATWCVSFKHTLLPRWPMNFVQVAELPADARIVAFTGKPDAEDALIGHWPDRSLRQKLYKHVRPTPWIAQHWR